MSELRDTLERIAVGIERLAEDPVIQMETAPPNCPHCERMNPTISVEESGGTGPMAEFVIRAKCSYCNEIFFALPIQWECVQEISHLEKLLEAQKELTGHGPNGSQ